MTVSEMIQRLERIRDEEGDLEVRMTYQPNYPLQSHIRGIATSSEIADAKFEDEEPGSVPEDAYQDEIEPVCYIVESSQVYDTPYGPREAFSAAW